MPPKASSQFRPAVPAGPDVRESVVSAVSWPAVIAGAFVAVAVSVMLLAFGGGIGFAAVSPWGGNPSATSFSILVAVWLIIVQWVSSGLGGYLTGRLRTKWTDVHSHEVLFRDTANGFLTWAVASVVVVGLSVSAGTSALSGATHAAATVAAGAASGAGQAAGGAAQGAAAQAGASGYLLDSLFRPEKPSPDAQGPAPLAEASRIVAASLGEGGMAPADRTYLAQLIAARAGIPQADAEKRIDDVVAKAKAAEASAKEAADAARKAASSFAFFTAFSMLIGAFIACAAAALGGRQRDEARPA